MNVQKKVHKMYCRTAFFQRSLKIKYRSCGEVSLLRTVLSIFYGNCISCKRTIRNAARETGFSVGF